MPKTISLKRKDIVDNKGFVTPTHVDVAGLSTTQQTLFNEYIIDILINRYMRENGYAKS